MGRLPALAGTAVRPPLHTKKTSRVRDGAHRISIPAMVGLDLLCIVLGLLTFAYFHHVRDFLYPPKADPVVLLTPAPAAASPSEPTATPGVNSPEETAPEPEAASELSAWGERFADQFTDGEIIQTENSYRSANVSVTLTTVEKPRQVYRIAEIYISDLKYLRTSLGTRGFGSRNMAADLAGVNGALVAISGDYYSARQEGIVIRNGILYRETRFEDICVLLNDGRMLTLSPWEFDLEQLKESAPWQVWSFGPKLLNNGEAISTFRSTVESTNPRSAIGYVEPGHYFFVQVDGRGANGSRGMTLGELSQLFAELGCVSAYNLDGGQTAGIVWNGRLLSHPYGRSVSDIIYITDHPEDEEG